MLYYEGNLEWKYSRRARCFYIARLVCLWLFCGFSGGIRGRFEVDSLRAVVGGVIGFVEMILGEIVCFYWTLRVDLV